MSLDFDRDNDHLAGQVAVWCEIRQEWVYRGV